VHSRPEDWIDHFRRTELNRDTNDSIANFPPRKISIPHPIGDRTDRSMETKGEESNLKVSRCEKRKAATRGTFLEIDDNVAASLTSDPI